MPDAGLPSSADAAPAGTSGLRAPAIGPPSPGDAPPPGPPPPAALPSFRSPSGKRMHPRVQHTGLVEVEGTEYPLRDWSLGGCALAETGPRGAEGDPFRLRLRLGQDGVGLVVEALAKVARVEAGEARAFQFVELPPEGARLLDELAEAWLTGTPRSPGALLRGTPVAARPMANVPRWLAPWLPQPRLLRTGLALGLGLTLLAGGGGFVLSRSLVVYSDFAAVSSALRLVRAPQGGVVSLADIGLGSTLRAGAPMALLEPVVPPQVLAEVEPQAQALAARLGQLRGELEQAEAGFETFRRRAKAGFDAATLQRQLVERQVVLQQRIQGRIATLARSNAATPMQADQLEVELLNQRRVLADAVLIEVTARNLLEDAQAGRFVSDGRTTQRTPLEIRRELVAAEAARRDMLGTLERLGARITLTAPCDCQVAQLGATAGSFVAAGDPVLGLAEPVMPESVEVDALVDATRLGFLRQGQAVEVFLAGDAQATPGRITGINYNPENQGRIGLPDNLRSLKSYGVLTVTLQGSVPQARPGLPALVKAPLELRQVFRSLPGMAWLVTERAGARPPDA